MNALQNLTAATLAAILVLGCKSAEPADSPPAKADAPEVWTGVLSETEFADLHEHTGRAAPALKGGEIDLDGSRAYLSLPDTGPGAPGVVVIHEWWGLNEHIEHWADRLAANGYAALAVDLYGGQVATTRDEAMALMRSVDEPRAHEILKAAHAFLVEDPRVRAGRTGSIGWCFGGGWSLQLALDEPDLDACVIYYGRLVTDVEQLSKIGANVLGIFGQLDQSIPLDMIADFDEALTAAGRPHTIRIYDANHAFANPSSARYDEEAAAAAWDEARAFLARNLRGGP